MCGSSAFLLPLVGQCDRLDGPCDGQAAEHVAGGGDQALRVMALAGLVQPAVGVERRPQRYRGGEVVLGAVDGEHRQPLPRMRIVCGPDLIGKAHGVVVHLLEGGPGQLGACLGDRTAMDGLCFEPQATASGLAEKRPRLAVHAFALAAGCDRQQKNKQGRERELGLPDKRLGRSLEVFR